MTVIERIAQFTESRSANAYINFGGGEPFLRKDMVRIIQETKSLIPDAYIAIDTNGTLLEPALLDAIAGHISSVGFSVDGLEDTHNRMRNPRTTDASYRKCIALIDAAISLGMANLVEVTTIASRHNLRELPILAEQLSRRGVRNYSIHRAMPVGRMARKQFELVPDASQYLEMYISVIKAVSDCGSLSFHIHHTLESIYSALLLDKETYRTSPWNANYNHYSSVGIDATGDVFVDPWLMFQSPSSLSIGSALQSPLNELLSRENPLFGTFLDAAASKRRCGGCEIGCSGGSRICAVATRVDTLEGITIPEFINEFSATDPACPLHFYGNCD